MKDLEKIIPITRQIIQIIFNDHSDFAVLLNNLKIKFENRYAQTETIKKLNKTIKIIEYV